MAVFVETFDPSSEEARAGMEAGYGPLAYIPGTRDYWARLATEVTFAEPGEFLETARDEAIKAAEETAMLAIVAGVVGVTVLGIGIYTVWRLTS